MSVTGHWRILTCVNFTKDLKLDIGSWSLDRKVRNIKVVQTRERL